MEEIQRLAQPQNLQKQKDLPAIPGYSLSLLDTSASNKSSKTSLKYLFRSWFTTSEDKMVNPVFVILPLYIYPTLNAWSQVYNSVAENPNLSFYIIINPNSGPGNGKFPNSDYVAGITKMNSYANTQLLGYVHTKNATRSISSVTKDIDTYNGWAAYSKGDIHMDGIFFDEAPSAYTQSSYSYMQTATNYVRNVMRQGYQHVHFNPGVVPDARYYALADKITAFENYYSAYVPVGTLGSIPQAHRSNSSVMIHNFKGTSATLSAVISDLVGTSGVGGLYISDSTDYDQLSSSWSSFCQNMTSTIKP